ncbi:MAG: endonuclease [Xanthomonadales bacterium]|nr:endonuclease [Xanthomonadales bacterium]
MIASPFRNLPLILLSALVGAAAPAALAQTGNVTLIGGAPAVQTFDALASAGTGSAVPAGWVFVEAGTNANTTYAADTGSTNSGNTYSYGSSGSGERAFGLLRSGSLVPTIGARLSNDSGAAIGQITVTYTGEQWRLGATGRNDRLDFQYSLDATSVSDAAATWVDVDALDFGGPVSTGTAGALDGNAAPNRTLVSATVSGINLAAGATLFVRWLDVDVSGADDGLAVDDASFGISGDPPVDLPPTVGSTTPANGATNVAPNVALAVGFSEAVAFTPGGATLQCATSGTHTVTIAGGPVNWTLAHTPAFATGEACTLTILASAVTDLDGVAQAMATDYVAAFTLSSSAGGPGPNLIASLPAPGATKVPRASDLRAVFDAAVTTTPGAFSLACNGNPITLTETGTGSTRTLTPASVMPVGAACTFAINGAAVTNGSGEPMSASPSIAFTVAPAYDAAAYYAPVNTTDPGQLRCSLHQVIRGHVMYPYSGPATNTWTILETAQAMPGDPTRIIDVYRNRAYLAISDRAGTGSGLTYNREHTWPNSLGFPSQSGNLGFPNAPYTDTHMLWLSDTQWNADRGNKPFANCPSGCGERVTEVNGGVGGGSGTYPGNSNWVRTPDGNQGSFEVWNHRKGEMARAIFYMAIRYEGGTDPLSGQTEPQLELTDTRSLIVGASGGTAYMGLLADLLAWHAGDPPDAEERARNDTVQAFQGNRNPFVDHPEWATRALFESVGPAVCELAVDDLIFADGFEAPAP